MGVKAASKTVPFNHLAGEVDGEPAAETSHVKSGILSGKLLIVLVDTSTRISAVRADLVDKSKLEEGTAEFECVHGDLISYLTTQITLKIDGWFKELNSCRCAKITGGCPD